MIVCRTLSTTTTYLLHSICKIGTTTATPHEHSVLGVIGIDVVLIHGATTHICSLVRADQHAVRIQIA
jgi:hypothetical protein